MSRVVLGLISAAPCPKPKFIGTPRPRKKCKQAGLAYERALAKALPEAKHGKWFEFTDRAGPGWCQPDLILQLQHSVVVLEAKYTWTEAGHRQVELLYKPVLALALGLPVFGLVVCKVLTREVDRRWVCSTLPSALARAASGQKTVLHWLGGALAPLRPAPLPIPLASAEAIL